MPDASATRLFGQNWDICPAALIKIHLAFNADTPDGAGYDCVFVSLTTLFVLASLVAKEAPLQLAQVQVERTVVRIRPVQPQPSIVSPVRWEEKKGPKCVLMGALSGAMVSSSNSIDLIMRSGTRMRAKLQKSCPTIDFYSGFYVKPTKDGRICEDRDLIHSRSGGECEIDKFRSLVAKK